MSMPPPFCGLHDDDHPAGQKSTEIRNAQLCLRYGTNERLGIAGYGPGARVSYRRLNRSARRILLA